MKDTSYSNLWLFEKRSFVHNLPLAKEILEDDIGACSPKKTGGVNYSKFNPAIAEKIINFYSEDGDIILDPFSGRTRAAVAGLKNRKYIGYEVAKEVSDYVNGILEKYSKSFPFQPEVINKDSLNMDNVEKVDLVFSCPPYWNLERYPSCDGQLSDIKEYSKFLKQLELRIKKSCSVLKDNGYAAFVVGDFRKNGNYIPFHSDFIMMMENIGMRLHDIIVIQSVDWRIANQRFGSLKNHKITAKVCEYLLVFTK